MAEYSVTFNPTLQNLRNGITQASKQFLKNERDAVKFLSRRWVAIAREEAPTKTGKFRAGIESVVVESETATGFFAGSPSPLGKWINKGTRPHKIYPRRANSLYFFWGKISKWTVVPKGGGFKTHVFDNKLFIGKGFVRHPGTKPNPYVDRTFNRWITEAEKEMLKVADNFVLDVASPK